MSAPSPIASLEPVAGPVEPFGRILSLGSDRFERTLIIAVVAAMLLHVAGAAQAYVSGDSPARWARDLRQSVRMMLGIEYDVELAAPKPPPPPPPAPEPEQAQAPAPKTQAPKVAATAEEPPPAAAQAGKILTQQEDPDAPVDLTGDGFVTGNADSYAGGATAREGTSASPVRNANAAATGVVGGTGKPKAEAAVAVDSSRPAGLVGETNWDCPFPPEADADQIDLQNVRIIVVVRPDGTPESVRVMEDPGHGFARAARNCAMQRRFAAALDRNGHPITSSTPPILIKFVR